jgi:predicted phosphoribosyltransferase
VEADRDALDLALRGNRPLPDMEDRTVILVDDGLATGASMRAAADYARRSAQAVVIAVPTASPEVVRSFEALGYQTVSLIVSPRFGSVGQWYTHFEEVSSDATRAILEAAWQP